MSRAQATLTRTRRTGDRAITLSTNCAERSPNAACVVAGTRDGAAKVMEVDLGARRGERRVTRDERGDRRVVERLDVRGAHVVVRAWRPQAVEQALHRRVRHAADEVGDGSPRSRSGGRGLAVLGGAGVDGDNGDDRLACTCSGRKGAGGAVVRVTRVVRSSGSPRVQSRRSAARRRRAHPRRRSGPPGLSGRPRAGGTRAR